MDRLTERDEFGNADIIEKYDYCLYYGQDIDWSDENA